MEKLNSYEGKTIKDVDSGRKLEITCGGINSFGGNILFYLGANDEDGKEVKIPFSQLGNYMIARDLNE